MVLAIAKGNKGPKLGASRRTDTACDRNRPARDASFARGCVLDAVVRPLLRSQRRPCRARRGHGRRASTIGIAPGDAVSGHFSERGRPRADARVRRAGLSPCFASSSHEENRSQGSAMNIVLTFTAIALASGVVILIWHRVVTRDERRRSATARATARPSDERIDVR